MLAFASLMLGVAVAADGTGAVRVSASGPGLAVVADRARLSSVLEEIGRHSGIRVTYEGAAPATLLTCDFLAATPAEAFLRALEGNGLNYALYGGTVDIPGVLLISAPSGAAALARTTVSARHAEPSTEAGTMLDSPDEEPPTVVAPPPGGAIPARFLRQAETEFPSEGGGEDVGRPSTELGMQSADSPTSPSSPMQGQVQPRDRADRRRRNGAGHPQN